MSYRNTQWKADPAWNADGSYNAEGAEADQKRTPSRAEVGVGSIWEIALDKYPGAWKVTKVNPRSIDLVNPTGARLRADVGLLRRTELGFVVDETAYLPHTGAVVTVATDFGGPRGLRAGTAYVVVKTLGIDTAKVAELGDDNGLVWPSIPVTVLRPYRGTITF